VQQPELHTVDDEAPAALTRDATVADAHGGRAPHELRGGRDDEHVRPETVRDRGLDATLAEQGVLRRGRGDLGGNVELHLLRQVKQRAFAVEGEARLYGDSAGG
jgi:hypothetical protein